MDISVDEISSVDKEITISANRSDLEPKFNEAFKKYKAQINMPGFRPGKVPVDIVKKRFGKEIELEEINKYIQDVFEKEVVPEYDPIGESQMVDLKWENDELEAKFKIGSRPEFELEDLGEIQVDRMVHDVSEEEVDEEVERSLEREGNWEEVDEPATEKSKVTIDAIALDSEGEPIEGEKEENQEFNLGNKENEIFRKELVGKKLGDVVDIEIGEEEASQKFRIILKKVHKLHKAKLTDAFAKEQSDGEAKNVDEYRSLLKSRMQNYYDQAADDLFKNEVVDKLVEAHNLEVPEVFINQLQEQYVQYAAQQNGGDLPHGFDVDAYKENMKDQAEREAKWFFINEKLQEKFDDIEIKPEDIDEHLTAEAARYGVTLDQMRNIFAQNPQQLESLRNTIRENKLFEKLKDEVSINEISKEKYQEKHDEDVK